MDRVEVKRGLIVPSYLLQAFSIRKALHNIILTQMSGSGTSFRASVPVMYEHHYQLLGHTLSSRLR